MSSLFDALSEELFQILKGSGKTLTLYGPDGNKTFEPSKARRVFAEPDNVMLSVIEAGSDSDVRLYLSQSTDVEKIGPLIDLLRLVATRYNVMFNVRKFGRELRPKDFAYQTAGVTESSMYGTTRTSYQRIGDAKMIVKHTVPVREQVIGSRSRNILSIFVETIEGERFKFPANHLSGGRAFARHIDLGGKPHDEIGTQISELALECLNLARVGRFVVHGRNHLGEDASALRAPLRNRIVEIRKAFSSLTGPRGYLKVTEAGLPLQTTILSEDNSMGQEIDRLMGVLGIDSNHALAESLTPVALLTMGENMTQPTNMFHGIMSLDESDAQALIEALISEYGYTDKAWTQMGENLAFSDAAVFEDAQSFLDLNESVYALHEDDQFMTYADAYVNSRGESDSKDAKELADGLRKIFSGSFETPYLPSSGMPQFSNGNARMRYFLDLYITPATHDTDVENDYMNPKDRDAVAQGKMQQKTKPKFVSAVFSEPVISNYISSIIDKLADGKKLDGAERTVAKKLYDALEADLGELDESMGDDWDKVYDQNKGDVDYQLGHVMDDITPEDVLNFGGNEHVVIGDDPAEFDAMSRKALVDDTKKLIYRHLEGSDAGHNMPYSDDFLQHDAEKFVDEVVIPFAKQKGFEIDESINEFAETDDRFEHHGLSAGDQVSSDLGHGNVLSVDGDIAVVEFLNGKTKEMHVDDLDKVEGLGEGIDEAALSEWFKQLTPESVLGNGSQGDDAVTWFGSKKPVGCTCSPMQLYHVGCDCGAEEAVIGGDKSKSMIDDVKVDEEALDEKAGDIFSAMPTDILRKKMAAVAKDPKYADYRMQIRKELLRREGKEVDEGYAFGTRSGTFTDWLDIGGRDEETEVEVSYYMDDEHPMIDEIKIKGTDGTIEFNDLDDKTRGALEDKARETEAEDMAAERDYRDDARRDDAMMDRMYGEEEEAPAEPEIDEEAELRNVLKNAMFRK